MKQQKRLVVSRGKDGSIKIDSATLYRSKEVLRQLDATVRFSLSTGLVKKRLDEEPQLRSDQVEKLLEI